MAHVSIPTNDIGGDVNPPTIKYARINATVINQNTVIAAVTGKKIVVIGYFFTASAAVVADWNDGAGTILGGPFDLGALGQARYVGSMIAPCFETASGQALRLNLSAAVNARGHLTYYEE